MGTTIHTSSINYFTKIQKYLTNKRILFMTSLNNGVYTFHIFGLTHNETTSLITKMPQHFHLTKPQEPLALAA